MRAQSLEIAELNQDQQKIATQAKEMLKSPPLIGLILQNLHFSIGSKFITSLWKSKVCRAG
jgi:ATP/ADP translocase